MKTWLKILSLCVAALLLCFLLLLPANGPEACCLCDSFRYHAPCLIDLQTGNIFELALYAPHETAVAELAEKQPLETSFLRFGEISGYYNASLERMEMEIPFPAKTFTPALCRTCKKLLPFGYTQRYVLADLYDWDHPQLIPIKNGAAAEFRCYAISVSKSQSDTLTLVIQGTLP